MNSEFEDKPESRQWLANGLAISQRIIIACIGMILPIAGGWWALGKLGYPIAGMLLGLVLGMLLAGLQLVGLVKWLNQRAATISHSKPIDPPSVSPASENRDDSDAEDPWDRRWREKWETTPDQDSDNGE